MEKLRKEINLIILILLLLFSCQKSNSSEFEKKLNFLQKTSFQKYKHIYDAASDTIKSWLNDSIASTKMANYFPYQIDSLCILNKDSTRFYTTINFSSSPFKDDIADMDCELGGAKIGGKWYFFFGASLVVPREFYQDSIYSPLTFEELSGVAHRNYHQAAHIQNADGSFKANEEFFESNVMNMHTYGCPQCKTEAQKDSFIVAYCTRRRQKKIDPKEIAEIKASMAASVRPKEPHYIKLTLQKWGDNIAHLFE